MNRPEDDREKVTSKLLDRAMNPLSEVALIQNGNDTDAFARSRSGGKSSSVKRD